MTAFAILRFLFGPIGRWVLIAAFAVAAFLYLDNRAYQRGFAEANLKAEQATERAIHELADEADRARVRRRLCVERGGVWSFADNQCAARQAHP